MGRAKCLINKTSKFEVVTWQINTNTTSLRPGRFGVLAQTQLVLILWSIVLREYSILMKSRILLSLDFNGQPKRVFYATRMFEECDLIYTTSLCILMQYTGEVVK